MKNRTPHHTLPLAALSLGLILALPAQAALQARDLNNDTVTDAYYDTVLDITWQKNANLAATNTFGLAYNTNLGNHPNDSWAANYTEQIYTSGSMTWGAALHWIDAMNAANYLGYDDWRLPTVSPINGSTFNYFNSNNGTTDYGYNISAPGTAFAGATGSELAYMYYNHLGNIGFRNTSGVVQSGYGLVDDPNNPNDESLFSNLQSDVYWSGTEYAPNITRAWYFETSSGVQSIGANKAYDFSAWAVRPGDVAAAPVPEAESYALLALGMGLVGWLARRRG